MSDAKLTPKAGALALMLMFSGMAVPVALAAEDFEVDTSSIGRDNHGVITSDQFLELGVPNANSLRIEGEQAMKLGNNERAIMVLQRSVELAPRDIDGRILYSEALEKKLIRQKLRDPKLYNFLIKQWLFVAKMSEFADQGQQGFQHLFKLTGTVPKRWEKERKYLTRVLIPEDGSVKVSIGRPANANGKPDAEPIAHRKKDDDM